MRRWLTGLLGVVVLVGASSGAALAAPAGGGDGNGNLIGDGGGEGISYRDTIDFSIEDIQAFWTATLPEVFGIEYEDVSEILPYDSESRPSDFNECTPAGAEYEDIKDNAQYCLLDDTVTYDDESLFPRFYKELGPFAIAFALAHEWGHAIQGRVAPEAFTGEIPSVYVELQADCYAGAWSDWVDSGESDLLQLDPGDLEVGIGGLLEVRDPIGVDPTDESQIQPHGNGFDRVSAFQEGKDQGAARCADYFNTPPLVTELPFTSEEDLANEGNLPFADAIDFGVQDLDLYWSTVFDISELPYDGIGEVDSYNVKRKGTLPECVALDLDPDRPKDYRGGVFYCPGEDFVAYDTAFLKAVHGEIGDFGAMLLGGNAWATGMQEDLGVEDDPANLGLQADCFGGAWTGSIPVDLDGDAVGDFSSRGGDVVRESAISLSPGDLDEVVISFVTFRDPTAEAESGVTAFERIQNFRTGFFSQTAETDCAAVAG
ncbi:MAG: neutral zinc metallopeptidase [Gemmatimonadetes bacterium]|nr:neutral zinc metallopeptidase [Gemmatimonadota bacterium]